MDIVIAVESGGIISCSSQSLCFKLYILLGDCFIFVLPLGVGCGGVRSSIQTLDVFKGPLRMEDHVLSLYKAHLILGILTVTPMVVRRFCRMTD